MKQLLAFFSSLLLFAGLKAQTPTIKKETIKPIATQPGLNADQSKAIKIGSPVNQSDKVLTTDKTIKVADKTLKTDHIKKTPKDAPLKELTIKPVKY